VILLIMINFWDCLSFFQCLRLQLTWFWFFLVYSMTASFIRYVRFSLFLAASITNFKLDIDKTFEIIVVCFGFRLLWPNNMHILYIFRYVVLFCVRQARQTYHILTIPPPSYSPRSSSSVLEFSPRFPHRCHAFFSFRPLSHCSYSAA